MAIFSRKNQNLVKLFQKPLELSKIYFIPSMVKFPLIISKNGILNGIIGILIFGGIFTTISNLILKEIILDYNSCNSNNSNSSNININNSNSNSNSNSIDNINDNTSINRNNNTNTININGNIGYEDISKNLMKKYHKFVKFSIFIFRSLLLFYCIDLIDRFLRGIHISHFLSLPFLLITSILLTASKTISSIGSWRNTINFIILSLTTSSLCLYEKFDLDKIHISNGYFDSIGVTMLCFSQQTVTTNILGNIDNIQIILSGVITVISYIIIGICGFIYEREPDANWMKDTPKEVRIVSTVILLTTSLMAYPIILRSLMGEKKRTTIDIILSLVLVPLTRLFIKSEIGSSLAMIFSSLIMIVFPVEFYLRRFLHIRGFLYIRRFGRKSPFILLQILGIMIIFKGVFEILNKKVL